MKICTARTDCAPFQAEGGSLIAIKRWSSQCMEVHLLLRHAVEIDHCALLARLVHEVETARVEAVDNAKYLAPLRKLLQRFVNTDEFTELPEKFKVCSTRDICINLRLSPPLHVVNQNLQRTRIP